MAHMPIPQRQVVVASTSVVTFPEIYLEKFSQHMFVGKKKETATRHTQVLIKKGKAGI
jgi:hypothetical protein